MTVPADATALLTAIEYPPDAMADPDNVLTQAVTAAFTAAAEVDAEVAPWLVLYDIAALLPAEPLPEGESRNYQRGLAAGIALALLASA